MASRDWTCVPIVIVDDDASVRRSISRLLEVAGCTVLTFGSAEAFLASRHATREVCLVLDIHLPGMSGLELAGWLDLGNPRARVVLISGHERPLPTRSRVHASCMGFLRKPFDDEDLLDAVSRALDDASR